MSPDVRRSTASALVVLASVLLVAATLAGYARRALFNSDQFADRATATLGDSSVRTLIADRVTDRVILRHQADLLAARPIVASTISDIVGGGAFRSLFRRGALDVHRAVFDDDQDTVTLTLADVGTVAAAALRQFRPGLAAEVDDRGQVVVVKRRIGAATGDLVRVARDVRFFAYLLAALALAAGIAALAISPDRRHTASRLGFGAIAVGLTVVVMYALARAIVLDRFHDPEERAAAAAVWSAFLGDLRALGLLLAGSGAVIAAAAASLLRPFDIEGALRRAWRIVATEPERVWARIARAAVLIAVGALVIAKPIAALQIAATLVGVFVVYLGIEAILSLIYKPVERRQAARPVRRRRVGRVALPVIAALVIAGAVAAFVGGGGASAPAATISRCNGHAALCDRPLDEVVLPATHNAMSAPLPGWFSAEQERPIGGQLSDGIRGLLLDTHYGDKLANGRVRTFFKSPEDLDLVKGQDAVSPTAVAAATRLRARLGFRGKGERGMYLCHTFCELGFTPLQDGLKDIHDFLATHPAEVVVVINQDYVTPADFVKAIGDAGLAPYAFTPPSGSDWPTLRQMIESDRRLLLLAENHAGAAPWYQPAYKRLTEETPYLFRTVATLTDRETLDATCRPNRGPEKAPLFLINHWVTTTPVPRPSDAATLNAYEPLLRRARECQRIRHHVPNLLAVNFYKQGDVFRVVDALNGL
jgi:uncharacterized membrane protein HdeD (DUF308 family)